MKEGIFTERTLKIEELYKLKDLMYRICQSGYAKGYAEAKYYKTNDNREAKLAQIANEEKERLQEEFLNLLFRK